MKKVFLAFSVLLLTGCSSGGEFKKNFQSKPENLGVSQTLCGLNLENAADYFIEKSALPLEASLKFVVDGDTPTISLVSPIKCDEVDKFYCEQAIWEGLSMFSVGSGSLNHFERTFSNKSFDEIPLSGNCEKQYLKNHPDQVGKVVVMHFIPPSTYFLFPQAVANDELHSIANLRAIKIRDLHDVRLQELRKEWLDYIRQFKGSDTPNRQELLDKADALFSKYESLFLAV